MLILLVMSQQKIKVELLPHQFDTLTDLHKITLLKGGIGSGKSWTGLHHCVEMSRVNPNSLGLIAANSYKQLQDATMATVLSGLDEYKIQHVWKPSKGELFLGPKKFLCRSLENYNLIRGAEYGDFWGDETRDTEEKAFKVLLGRLRCKRARRLRGLLTTSPNGYDWLHDYFVGNRRPGFNMIEARSMDNHHLPDGYLETLMGSYDPKMIKQEIYGEFINLSADAVYYAFDRIKNVRAFEKSEVFGDGSEWPMKIGMDFNVNPMTAVMGWVTKDTIYIWDEAFLKNSNTYEMSKHLIDNNYGQLSIIPDSTGKALKTSAAGLSDHQILEDAGFAVLKTHNPYTGDRFNCVNGLLHRAKLVIHPRCVKLIRDLERVSREDNDDELTHISDALGYLCWYHFPIMRPHQIKQYRY